MFPDWWHSCALSVSFFLLHPLLTFLIFSSSICLASLAICSSLIRSSSSSCSACCRSRSSRRFCRASRCGARRPWRSRVTHIWVARRFVVMLVRAVTHRFGQSPSQECAELCFNKWSLCDKIGKTLKKKKTFLNAFITSHFNVDVILREKMRAN